jgi:hypothetical protein
MEFMTVQLMPIGGALCWIVGEGLRMVGIHLEVLGLLTDGRIQDWG